MRDIGEIPTIKYHALMIALVIVLRFPALLLPVDKWFVSKHRI